MTHDRYKFHMAIQDFQSARKKAAIQEVLARISGKSNQLLSYEEVAEKLKLHARTDRGVQHIPLDAIVGSVGRDTDFTRALLPRRAVDRQYRGDHRLDGRNRGAGCPQREDESGHAVSARRAQNTMATWIRPITISQAPVT